MVHILIYILLHNAHTFYLCITNNNAKKVVIRAFSNVEKAFLIFWLGSFNVCEKVIIFTARESRVKKIATLRTPEQKVGNKSSGTRTE